MKELLTLEARLNSTESELLKCQNEKVNLQNEISTLRQAQTQLVSKIKESQEFLEICSAFLQKNGLMANTSFLSDANHFSEEDLFQL